MKSDGRERLDLDLSNVQKQSFLFVRIDILEKHVCRHCLP